MKDIILKITGKTLSVKPMPPDGSLSDDDIEFVTEGKMSTKDDISYITYEESSLSGMDGCQTSLTIAPKKMRMKRVSSKEDVDETIMEFEEGKRHNGVYITPIGNIDMEVLASKVSDLEQVDEKTQRMSIDYAVSLKGLMESRKNINIEIVSKN